MDVYDKFKLAVELSGDYKDAMDRLINEIPEKKFEKIVDKFIEDWGLMEDYPEAFGVAEYKVIHEDGEITLVDDNSELLKY